MFKFIKEICLVLFLLLLVVSICMVGIIVINIPIWAPTVFVVSKYYEVMIPCLVVVGMGVFWTINEIAYYLKNGSLK